MRYVVIALNHAQFNFWIQTNFDSRDIRRKLGDRITLKSGVDYTYCNCPKRLRSFKNIKPIYVGQYYMLKDIKEIEEVIRRGQVCMT